MKRIVWRKQALVEGDISERARQRAAELANEADLRVRSSRGTFDPPRLAEPSAPSFGITGRFPSESLGGIIGIRQ